MKKILTFFLTAVILISLFPAVAYATDTSESFRFALTSDGKDTVTADTGDEIIVTFTLKRTDLDDSYAMYAVQNEIAYDSSFFELVENSVETADGVTSSIHDTGSGVVKVYMNDYSLSTSGDTYPAELKMGSFKLKVIGTSGSSKVQNTNYLMSTAAGADTYSAAAADLTVTINSTSSGGSLPGGSSSDDTKSSTGTSSDAAARFSDIDEGAWYEGAVDYVVNAGLFDGVSDTAFDPNGSMNRAMLTVVLWRLNGKPEENGTSSFTDVVPDEWYTQAVAWASSEGIVNGLGDGTFGLDQDITREQIAVMLWRYASVCGNIETDETGDLSAFADADTVSSWAKEAMGWAVGAGIITGTSDTALDPSGTATRAQVSVMLMRFNSLLG